MRLLVFLLFSQYGLACKYGIIFQISIYSPGARGVNSNGQGGKFLLKSMCRYITKVTKKRCLPF